MHKTYRQCHTRMDSHDPPRGQRSKGHVRHLTPTRRSMHNSLATILTAAPSNSHKACRASFQSTKPRAAAFGWKDHDPLGLARATGKDLRKRARRSHVDFANSTHRTESHLEEGGTAARRPQLHRAQQRNSQTGALHIDSEDLTGNYRSHAAAGARGTPSHWKQGKALHKLLTEDRQDFSGRRE